MISAANGGGVPPRTRQPCRPNLRQATFILPKTGERVKRAVTFGEPLSLDGADSDGPSDDRSPLLGRRGPRLSEPGTWRRVKDTLKKLLEQAWSFANSKTGRGVFKCSLAYFLGSLATFLPFIAAFLGQQDGKHMVATITVYFHPARSRGSMFEAILLAALAFLYAVLICFTSMGVSILFGRTLDMIVLGHVIVLLIFCGGGLGFVGWIKQRLGNPLVNVACSLTSLAIITVVTKEGAVQAAVFSIEKVVMVLQMIVLGCIATTAVCFLISPVSARTELRDNLIQVTDLFADMLTSITRSFLTGSEAELHQKQFLDASNQYKDVFNSMSKSLHEAKYEHYVMGTEREYRLEAKLVNCMQRLAQNMGGLRSAASTQFLLLAQSTSAGGNPTRIQTSGSFSTIADGLRSPSEAYGVLTAIDESSEDCGGSAESPNSTRWQSSNDEDYLPSANSPSGIFSRFIIHLGPSMKSLAVTLKQILDELPYGPGPEFCIAPNTQLRASLVEAVDLYNKSREEALALLYKNKDLNQARPVEEEADNEEVAASCGHFSFSLQYFANDMKVYLDILDDLKFEIDERPGGRTWRWLKLWRRVRGSRNLKPSADPEQENPANRNEENYLSLIVPNPSERKILLASALENDERRASYAYRVWKALGFLRRDDTKFAIKVGVGAALYALPSFLVSTRPIYQHFRGEWGLLSYMLVCSMTIGASNTTSYARFLGTCIGAVCAIVAWIASQGNVFALAAFGWLMSLWTAYIIVAQGKGPMGRFIMLTYNLSALYAYSLSVRDMDDDDDEGGVVPDIVDIAFHRVVAVLSGCLWGLIVTRLIWPISARRKLKDGLSVLWLRMGLTWKRDPLAMFLEGDIPHPYMDLREEFALHRFLAQLEGLRSSASSEVDLRGPFANEAYGRILKSTGSMLDAFHAMNVVIMKDLTASKGEAELLKYTANERAQLCSRISHLFQVMASSMKLEFPLNDALPNTDHARDRLLAKIFRFRKTEDVANDTKDEDYALLYAYALITGLLSKEIKEVGKELEKLFGILNADLLKLQ